MALGSRHYVSRQNSVVKTWVAKGLGNAKRPLETSSPMCPQPRCTWILGKEVATDLLLEFFETCSYMGSRYSEGRGQHPLRYAIGKALWGLIRNFVAILHFYRLSRSCAIT